MDKILTLKAVADQTRMKMLTLLLRHNYCVRALARKLGLAEATVSQHLKVLREAGLLSGEKRGYFMHYDVRRDVLRELAREIDALAATQREDCAPSAHADCRAKDGCGGQTKESCHGRRNGGEGGKDCKCHQS